MVLLIAVLLAVVGIAALPRVGEEPALALRVGAAADAPRQDAPELPVAVTTTTAPSPTTVPTTSPTAKRPKTSASADSADFGPEPPGTVRFSYDAARTTWEGSQNGITMKVWIDSPEINAGTPVTFHVEVASATDPCCSTSILWGDGSGVNPHYPICPNGPPGPRTVPSTFTHTYNRSQRWTFFLNASTGNCDVESRYASMKGVIYAGPGPATSQGPELPKVKAGEAGPYEHTPRELVLYASMTDDDGYANHFEVNWGDGSPVETLQGPPKAPCSENLNGWPSGSGSYHGVYPDTPRHTFPSAGQFTVTVTGVSVGCDGLTVQRGTTSFTWLALPG